MSDNFDSNDVRDFCQQYKMYQYVYLVLLTDENFSDDSITVSVLHKYHNHLLGCAK